MSAQKETLRRARMELEDLYAGIPDNSVDLTFKDMASFQQDKSIDKRVIVMEPIHEDSAATADDLVVSGASARRNIPPPGAHKSPSFDLGRSFQVDPPAARNQHHQSHQHHRVWRIEDDMYRPDDHPMPPPSPLRDDVPEADGPPPAPEHQRDRKRPGIPHSNFCAICSRYIHFFRHRCLACGRVYCRSCVKLGMGDMSEGRKCVDCLGKKFSQRYIKEAGKVRCCMGYSSQMKQQELIWAEKGPKKTAAGERRGRRPASATAAAGESYMAASGWYATTPDFQYSSAPTPERGATPAPRSGSRSPMIAGTPTRSPARSPFSPRVDDRYIYPM